MLNSSTSLQRQSQNLNTRLKNQASRFFKSKAYGNLLGALGAHNIVNYGFRNSGNSTAERVTVVAAGMVCVALAPVTLKTIQACHDCFAPRVGNHQNQPSHDSADKKSDEPNEYPEVAVHLV